eukprot:6177057-Pleurochrysis_carterae.AAC.1
MSPFSEAVSRACSARVRYVFAHPEGKKLYSNGREFTNGTIIKAGEQLPTQQARARARTHAATYSSTHPTNARTHVMSWLLRRRGFAGALLLLADCEKGARETAWRSAVWRGVANETVRGVRDIDQGLYAYS